MTFAELPDNIVRFRIIFDVHGQSRYFMHVVVTNTHVYFLRMNSFWRWVGLQPGDLSAILAVRLQSATRQTSPTCAPNEVRVQNPTTGEVLLPDRTTHEISVELPSTYFEIVWPTLVGVTDASSIIRAQFFYLVNLILLDWSWEFCHGQWNSIKNVCKSGDGSYWKAIT